MLLTETNNTNYNVKKIDNEKTLITINDKNIKLTIYSTPEYTFCVSDDIDSNKLNLINIKISSEKKITIEYIEKLLEYKNQIVYEKFDDYMNLFSKKKTIVKYINNTDKILQYFDNIKKIKSTIVDIIPKALLLTNEQRFNILLNEIEKINNDTSHKHYIVCNNDNPFNLSLRLKYDGVLGDKLEKYNKKYGIDYFEINIILDEKLYPYAPPKIYYVKPAIDINLILNINNIDIFSPSKWNYTNTLDNIAICFGNTMERYFLEFFDEERVYNELDTLLVLFSQLNTATTVKYKMDIKLDLNTTNKTEKTKESKSNGVGYGTHGSAKWDISKYLDTIVSNNNNIVYNISEIINVIKKQDNIDNFYSSSLVNFIEEKLTDITILEFNKNIDVYEIIIKLLFEVYEKQHTLNFNNLDFFQNIYKLLKPFSEEINIFVSNFNDSETFDEIIKNTYIAYLSFFELLKSIDNIDVSTNTVHNENDYITMVNNNNFLDFNVDDRNYFYSGINNSLSKKTIVNIISELSSLKKNLPIHWDTSVVFRTSKKNINYVSFIISGPKDTPYSNGLFEFHGYFPDNYPNTTPKVLIKTTDNGKVRFNPNLYNCGKVCLSLLGTWSGDAGESWNPQLSTFLQVVVSIQSLILIDKPYFNEPGYSQEIGTKRGENDSENYNQTIRYQTLRVAIVDMIKNPPPTYEQFVKEHFRLKKDEVFKTVEKWIEMANSQYKNKMEKLYEELKTLIS